MSKHATTTTPRRSKLLMGTILQMFDKKHCIYYMSPITKLLKKFEIFEWTIECQNAWEEIKN
jgi:hypothetical protein